jgi:serine protease Do
LWEQPLLLGEGVVALSVAVEKSLRVALVGSVMGIGVGAFLAAPHVQGRKDIPDWLIPAANAASLGLPGDFADIVDKVKPAVIGVRARVEADVRDPRRPLPPGSFPAPSFQQQEMPPGGRDTPFDILPNRPDTPGQPRPATSQGSGFFISADGYAVTTNHVIDHGKAIEITTDDGKRYAAKLVGADPKTDLALLKAEGGGGFASVQLADKTPRIGEWILAIGNPFGLGGTVTAGIISARARDIGLGDFDDFLQIDAPVNTGNSGGPTFDLEGNVVGVNSAIVSPSGGSIGIGFAIPAETVKMVIDQLREKGVVTRGWIGLQVRPISPEIAARIGLKEARGALVGESQANGPAAGAGIVAGDVIASLDDQPVKDHRDLVKKISRAAPGTAVKLGVFRKGEHKSVTVTLAETPK